MRNVAAGGQAHLRYGYGTRGMGKVDATKVGI